MTTTPWITNNPERAVLRLRAIFRAGRRFGFSRLDALIYAIRVRWAGRSRRTETTTSRHWRRVNRSEYWWLNNGG